MSTLPKDSVMLLSVVNTKLRDYYKDLDALCEAEEVNAEDIIEKLQKINYKYDKNSNQFV